jgi:hypothetical protein
VPAPHALEDPPPPPLSKNNDCWLFRLLPPAGWQNASASITPLPAAEGWPGETAVNEIMGRTCKKEWVDEYNN